MKSNKIFRLLLIILLLGSNIGCDRISKSIVRNKLDYYEKIEVIDDHLTLTKVENSGAFLSLGNNLPGEIKFYLLTVFPVIILILSLIFLLRNDISRVSTLGISFIIGGGIGNIYDRIVHGSVTDFLHIDFILFETGIFNMADVSIMTGFFLLVYEMIFRKIKRSPVSKKLI